MARQKATGSARLHRLQWRSRRGMRELDLLLLPFAHEALPALTEIWWQRYARLMECEDQQLISWLQRQDESGLTPARAALVGKILNWRNHAGQPS